MRKARYWTLLRYTNAKLTERLRKLGNESIQLQEMGYGFDSPFMLQLTREIQKTSKVLLLRENHTRPLPRLQDAYHQFANAVIC